MIRRLPLAGLLAAMSLVVVGCGDSATESVAARDAARASSAPKAHPSTSDSEPSKGPVNPFAMRDGDAAAVTASAQSPEQERPAVANDQVGERVPEADAPPAADDARAAESMVVHGQAGQLVWERKEQATMPYEQVELSVSGRDGVEIKQTFAAGEPMSISETLPDGTYAWEAVTVPTIEPYVRQQMTAARESGNVEAERSLRAKFEQQGLIPTEAQAKANRQSGYFSVQGGTVVRSDISE